MQQPKSRFAHTQQPETQIKPPAVPLYELLDFVMVRAPLLPIEAFLVLNESVYQDTAGRDSTDHESGEPGSLVPHDPRVRWALAIGSSALLNDLERSNSTSKDARQLKGKLLRFLIRMSTRPTPFGLFAGVALGKWGQETELEWR